MAEGRVTQLDAIVERGDATASATQVDVIVELAPAEEARATQIDVLVEMGPPATTRVTQLDALYELAPRIYRPCTRIWYNDVEMTGYTYGLEIAAQAAKRSIMTLCDTGALKWATLPAEWTVRMGGAWAIVVDNQLGEDLVNGGAYRRILIKVELPPHDVIWYEWVRAQMLRYEIDTSLGQAVEWSAGIIFDSLPRRTAEC